MPVETTAVTTLPPTASQYFERPAAIADQATFIDAAPSGLGATRASSADTRRPDPSVLGS
jgi:hypothetical protein